jgi:hypothetical protein
MPSKINPATMMPVPGTEWSVPAAERNPIRDALIDAVKTERAHLAHLFAMRAVDHDEYARESAQNEDFEDEQSHKFEASVWREAAEMVRARNQPAPKAAEPSEADDLDDEIAF